MSEIEPMVAEGSAGPVGDSGLLSRSGRRLRLTVGAKMGAGVGCVLLVFVLVGLVVYMNVGRLAENAEQTDHAHHTLEEIEQALIAVLEIENGLYQFLITGEDPSLEEYRHGIATLPEHLAEGRALTADEPAQQVLWADLDAKLDRLLREIERLIALRRDFGFDAAQEALVSGDVQEAILATHDDFHDLAEAEVELIATRTTATSESVSTTTTWVVGGVAVATIIGIAVVLYLTRSIAGPLRLTAERARQIAGGSLDVEPLKVNRSDELGELGYSFGVMVDALKTMVNRLAEAGRRLDHAAAAMTDISASMAGSAERTSTEADSAASTGDRVSVSVANVATSIEEMKAAITKISGNAQQAAAAAGDAVEVAHRSSDTMSQLNESSEAIEDIIKVINAIAEQTNLLALNATIEAARAGESGKGFAVVANEVKELATQTAGATEEISERIHSIRTETTGAVSANKLIGDSIEQISGISTAIAVAVEEQSFTVSEISQSVEEAATGSQDIARSITDVSSAANQTFDATHRAKAATKELADMATEINELVNTYH